MKLIPRYFVCMACNAKFFAQVSKLPCPRCGSAYTSRERIEPPWRKQAGRVSHPHSAKAIEGCTQNEKRGNQVSQASNGKSAAKRPVFRRRFGGVEVAVFEFKSENGRLTHSAKLTYSFRRRDSEKWEVSEYLPTSELLTASKLLEIAHTEIMGRVEASGRKV